jgi:hypothetical protein
MNETGSDPLPAMARIAGRLADAAVFSDPNSEFGDPSEATPYQVDSLV